MLLNIHISDRIIELERIQLININGTTSFYIVVKYLIFFLKKNKDYIRVGR